MCKHISNFQFVIVLYIFRESLLDRGTGEKRQEDTFRQHQSGIKVIIKSFTKAALEDLDNIGKAGGLVDRMVEGKRLV